MVSIIPDIQASAARWPAGSSLAALDAGLPSGILATLLDCTDTLATGRPAAMLAGTALAGTALAGTALPGTALWSTASWSTGLAGTGLAGTDLLGNAHPNTAQGTFMPAVRRAPDRESAFGAWDTRKKYQHATRVAAFGGDASGSHPAWDPV
jgi:hypothetical protein